LIWRKGGLKGGRILLMSLKGFRKMRGRGCGLGLPVGEFGRRGRQSFLVVLVVSLGACSGLLPRDEARTYSPWQTYQEAQQTFDGIVPNQTTVQDLQKLALDPKSNPNITILNYSDVLRRFLPGPSVNAADLDIGVQECIAAKLRCQGYEVNQQLIKRHRYGSFWLDFFNFQRKTDVAGWRFNGVLLMKDGTVIYKLTGGEPAIHQFEGSNNPLGPLQSMGNAAASRAIP
jgi:hypothetical protein